MSPVEGVRGMGNVLLLMRQAYAIELNYRYRIPDERTAESPRRTPRSIVFLTAAISAMSAQHKKKLHISMASTAPSERLKGVGIT